MFNWRYGNFVSILLVIFSIANLFYAFALSYIPRDKDDIREDLNFIPGKYLVKFDKDSIQNRNYSLFPKAEAKEIGDSEWKSISVNSKEEFIRLKRSNGVEQIVPDLKRYKTNPNDSYYNSQNTIINGQFDQWNMRLIGLKPTTDPTSAWNITTGSSETIVAVIDTGVALDNPDIGGGSGTNWTENNIWINQDEIPAGIKPAIDVNTDNIVTSVELINYFRTNNLDINSDTSINFLDMVSTGSPLRNAADNDSNGYIDDIFSYNFADSNPNVNDIDGHGTHVFGIVGATTNNNSTANPGVAGACWNCKIMPLKVINSLGFGYDSDIVNAIDYAVANGAKVINMSLGGAGYSQILDDAIVDAWNNGVLVVAASGNDYASASDSYPGGSEKSISVGATTFTDSTAAYSNTGQRMDMVAPGDYVLSTYKFASSSCVGAGYYVCSSGTSMASPHVAGIAALLFDLHKNDPQPWTMRDVRAAILKNTTDLQTAGFDNTSGYGRLNATNALNASTLANDAVNPTASLTAFGSSIVRGNINITGTASDTNMYLYTISFTRVSDSYIVKQVSGRSNITSNTLAAVNTTQLTDDLYNINMRVEDLYGNTVTSNTIQVTIDNTQPTTFSLTAPSNNSFTTNPRPSFTWSAATDSNGVVYDLILNGNTYASNLSPTNYTPSVDLADNVYTWSVNARDVPGNSRSSGSRTFTLDRQAPNTFTVNVTTNGTTPTFTFSTSDSLSGINKYQVSIDGGGFVDATSPFSPGAQSIGDHTVTVRAIDNAGNSRDSTANYNISGFTPTPTVNICDTRKTKGDFNCDGKVSLGDLSILVKNYNKNNNEADTNGDGKTSLSDLSTLVKNYNKNI